MTGTGSEKTHDVRRYAKARPGPAETGADQWRVKCSNTRLGNVLRLIAAPGDFTAALGTYARTGRLCRGAMAEFSATRQARAHVGRARNLPRTKGPGGAEARRSHYGDGAHLARRRPNRDYRFRFTNSCSISSLLVITRELAWKPRCVTIMFVNSWARSTLDISSAPLVTTDWIPSRA